MASIQFQPSLLHHRGPLARARPRSVQCSVNRQELFSRIAPVYDNLNDLLSLGQHRIWKRMAVSWSGAKEGQYVLDVCCGSGDLSFLLSEKVGPNGKVVGLDFSEEQLLVAQSRQHLRSKVCFKNIKTIYSSCTLSLIELMQEVNIILMHNRWIEGNALSLPFSDCCFDAITIGYGLRNVVDVRKAMQEMCRVLKPGAKVSVLDFNKSSNTFTTSVQGWVLDSIVVPVARGYGFENEYKYLNSSIAKFLTGNELEIVALEAGFSNANHFEIAGGLMGNLVATR